MHKKTHEESEKQSDHDILFSRENKSQQQAMEMAETARQKKYNNPSFCRKLFMGTFAENHLFPFPKQSIEDKEAGDHILEQLCEFLKENLNPDEVDHSREIPQNVIDKLVEMGMFSIKIPKEYDGLGLSQFNYNRIIMKVASYCGSTASLLSAHQSIGVPQPLKLFGTDEQKRKFLPRFRKGSISAFALTEPQAGSDPAKMQTTAELSEDGKHYIINGEKLWCTNGTVADIIVIMAQTTPKIIRGKEKKQISAFILEMNTPGIEIAHRCHFMGLNGIYNAFLKFTNVKVPIENLLWEEGRGLALALATLNTGRLTLPAASIGCAKQCLSISRRWGNERVQWGMPIGSHEYGKEKISYIASTTLAMEAMTWLTSSWADQENVDIRIEAAMAKLFCTESLWKITDLTMQLRGGRGYEKASSLKARGEVGYPIERMMRDCRINTILEGTSEIMKLFLSREAMDPHLSKIIHLVKTKGIQKIREIFKILGFYSSWLPSQFLYTTKAVYPPQLGMLQTHFCFVEKNAHKLARNLFYYMAKYRQHLEYRQLILGRLMNIGMDLFAISSTCSYAAMLKRENPQDPSIIKLANYFSLLARQRIKENFLSLTNNLDRETTQIAESFMNGNFRWLEEGTIWIGPKK